jgi:hypothetical protein
VGRSVGVSGMPGEIIAVVASFLCYAPERTAARTSF